MIEKKLIKRIVFDINKELHRNSYATEMNALIDYGEWSNSEPNFQWVVDKWKLTRESLTRFINMASHWGYLFRENFPTKNWKSKYPWHCPDDENPWESMCRDLECIFIAGNL